MNHFMLFFLMFCGGIAIALQPSINGRLAQKIGVIESSCISFVVGAAVLLIGAVLAGRGSFKELSTVSWWEMTGGALGAFFVTMTIIAVPRIGTTSAMAAVIGAQLTAGILLDHFGLFGFRTIPLDGKRLAGVVLLLAGTALIFRK